jgi:arsenate reductase
LDDQELRLDRKIKIYQIVVFRMAFKVQKFILLHNPNCSKSKEAENFLKSKSISFCVRNYIENPLSNNEIEQLYHYLDKKDRQNIVRDVQGLSENEVVDVLGKDATKMQRPILVDFDNKTAVIGRPIEAISTFLKLRID